MILMPCTPTHEVFIMINRDVTLPQANDLFLIAKTIEGISIHGWDKDDWVINSGYRERQYSYYADAAAWLGLLEVNKIGRNKNYSPNKSTLEFLNSLNQFEFYSRILLTDPLFNHIVKTQKENRLDEGIRFLMANPSKYGTYPSAAVQKRRIQCFCSWAEQLGL